MKKVNIAIEISHRFIKVALGYVQDEQVYVTYVKKVPINHLLENGVIKEREALIREALIRELSKINPVVDQEFNVNRLLNKVSLIFPPYGLEVYQTKQMTSVVSEERVVGEIDLRNLYVSIRNKRLPVDNELIDIIPEAFVIDNGNVYSHAPIGKVSSAINAFCKVLTIPKRIDTEYSSILKEANIQISRKVVSTFAAAELIATYQDVPAVYFLVDIGASSTSVSLIGKKQLYATRSFSWGGDNITDRIVSNFNISEEEAEKIKILYGLDRREIKFEYAVSKSDTPEGVNRHLVNELNDLIEVELDELHKNMNIAIEQLALTYKIADYQNIPIILIGGTSRLKGIVPYLVNKGTYQNISKLSPRTLGARDPSLFGVLGSIYVNYKYPNSFDNQKPVSAPVTRVE